MDFVLTLVGSTRPLSAGHIALLEKFCEEQGILMVSDPQWLRPHKVADILISECLNFEQMAKLRALFVEDRMDIFCTSSKNRKKSLCLADMDSTIVTSETLDELAAATDLKDKVSSITARAMEGEIDFETALKERVRLLKGLPAEALTQTLKNTKISKGAETLVKTMRHDGAFCVLVSGGFTFFTSAIATKIGFTQHHGNILEVKNEALTGTVKAPILDKEAKLRFLKLYCEELEINMEETLTIGDGANDLPMLQAANLGIGYRPKPLLKESLLNYIHFTDLTSVLYAQGYKFEDFK